MEVANVEDGGARDGTPTRPQHCPPPVPHTQRERETPPPPPLSPLHVIASFFTVTSPTFSYCLLSRLRCDAVDLAATDGGRTSDVIELLR
jgi:hypothetical protein